MSTPVVSIERVTKTFARGNVTALEDIELQIAAGEFISLIGPSGCGKSTLLRVIGDLIEPTAGTVTDQRQAGAAGARQDRDYGIVFQDAVLFDWRTVAKNVALPLELLGWGATKAAGTRRGDARARRADRLRRASPVAALGRDAAARLDRARARRSSRRCCLMDEPFGALDEMTRERLNLELLSIWQQLGSTVRLRHPLDLGGGLPLDARRRDEPAARAGSPASSRSTSRSRARSRRARPALLRARHGGARAAAAGGEQLLPEEEAAIAEESS